VTLSCRGLIWNPQTGEIAARPFAKLFDLHETSDRVPDSPPLAHEKLDGSLGILYRTIIGRVLDVSDTTVEALPVLDDVEAALPDDFRARQPAVMARLRSEHAVVVATVDALWAERPTDGDRRAFATWVSASPYRGLLFARLDGKSWQLDAWSHVRPDAVSVGTI
jgi:hypothetical protein